MTQPELRRISLHHADLRQASRPRTLQALQAAAAGSFPRAGG